MTDGLIDFLRARLDEELAEAEKQPDENRYDIDPWEIRKDTEVNYPCTEFLRIAKARVLRDVTAKRAAIEEYEAVVEFLREYDLEEDGSGRAMATSLRGILTALAAVYSNHPDYLQEWAP